MRLLYEVVLIQDQDNFSRLLLQLKVQAPRNVHIEIEGHTAATGFLCEPMGRVWYN